MSSKLASILLYKAHFTEAVLLSIHDYLVQAISQQAIAGLCLLHISAVFDTIGHSILWERLSH